MLSPGWAASAAEPDPGPAPVDAPLDTLVADDDQPIATNDFLDLERDLSECISAVPKPGCGREPTQAGDRGGFLQLALFGVMMTGLVVIGWRVTTAVRARDRAGAER